MTAVFDYLAEALLPKGSDTSYNRAVEECRNTPKYLLSPEHFKDFDTSHLPADQLDEFEKAVTARKSGIDVSISVYPKPHLLHKIEYRDSSCLAHRDPLEGPSGLTWFPNGKLWCVIYRVHDQNHRIEGPARMAWDGDGNYHHGDYWIDGKLVDPPSDGLGRRFV